MNIGIDARMYGPRVGGGGLGRYVEQLVNELQATDHKNRYVLFLKKENFDACVITNPNFEKRLADIHWYGLEEQLKMGGIIDREHLDLVHFPHFNVPLFVRTPFVVTIHDLILLDEPFSSNVSTRHQTIFTLKYWGYKLVLSHAVTRAKKIIAVSQATANSIIRHIEGVDQKKIEVMYEGITSLGETVDPALDHPPTPSFSRTGGTKLLYIGNAYPHKNLERLLDAFTRVRETHPDATLTLAGGNSIFYQRLLESRGFVKTESVAAGSVAAGSGDPTHSGVRFVPNPTDEQLAKLYREATLFVFPSRVEGFGLPPLEAMSASIPVAASDIPSLREILGDSADYFPPNDSDEMVRVIVRLLDDSKRREELIARGTQRIKQFSWKTMATHIAALYETCGKKTA